MSGHQAAHWINPEQLSFEGDFVDTCHVGQSKSSPAQPEGAGTTFAKKWKKSNNIQTSMQVKAFIENNQTTLNNIYLTKE
jgi:hypothetical protein